MRLRLILSFVLVVLVSVLGVVLIARQTSIRDVRAFMYRGGMTSADSLAAELAGYYEQNGSWVGVELILGRPGRGYGQGGMGGSMGMGMMNQRLRLADAQGNWVFDSSNTTLSGQISRSEKASAALVKVNGSTVGYLLAEGGMGYSRADESYLLNRLTISALTAGLIAGGLALLLALYLAYRLLRPVTEMTQAAVRFGQGDWSQRVSVSGTDELATLAQSFNHMADSLQHAEETRRAMTADIAHELRNPLAVQRAHLEAMQDGIYPLTGENLSPVLEQNLLLTRLVDDLRTLALADAGQLNLEKSTVDLPALCRRVVERFRSQADSQGVELTVEQVPPEDELPAVCMDALRVEQILTNLISNALRYTPQGGRIEITLQAVGAGLRLAVHDSGPGIPAEALPHVFERFYRVDRSRSRAEGGSGLGLAIARQLAEAHGGSLRAANHPQGGAVFTLILPLAASEQ